MNIEFKAPPGVWDTEPNYVKFKHSGLKCVIRRNDMGAWCGYVQLPKGKLLDQVQRAENRRRVCPIRKRIVKSSGYSAYALRGVAVHGGLTYCGKLRRNTGGIERGLWLGFDCAHYQDFVPKMAIFMQERHGQYRDMTYVIDETTSLAAQIKLLASG
ncbi:hypothetical protein [Methyloversatilis sp.]|uniref:hypothetical protein n=1 Tax=Methyloversatilis sp. TaxID=2569862 RepID=UPI0035B1B80C